MLAAISVVIMLVIGGMAVHEVTDNNVKQVEETQDVYRP